jgi:hypothetical protein
MGDAHAATGWEACSDGRGGDATAQQAVDCARAALAVTRIQLDCGGAGDCVSLSALRAATVWARGKGRLNATLVKVTLRLRLRAHSQAPLPRPHPVALQRTMRVDTCRRSPHHAATVSRSPATSYPQPPPAPPPHRTCRAAVTARKMAITPLAASSGSATVAKYCARNGGRQRHCSAPAPSGEADSVSAQPNSSRYARVPPAANAFSEPTACAHADGMGRVDARSCRWQQRVKCAASDTPEPVRRAHE